MPWWWLLVQWLVNVVVVGESALLWLVVAHGVQCSLLWLALADGGQCLGQDGGGVLIVASWW
jgi:hypothetical protein